jgi:protein SCO1/2
MMSRSKILPAVFLGLVCACGFGAAVFWHHQGRELPTLANGEFIVPRAPLPEFHLLDHHNRTFDRAALLGHWSLLYFGYTNCPDLCPATLTALAAMEKRLVAAGFRERPHVVFVSADAARDTPAQLAAYVPYFDPDFLGVTAEAQDTVQKFAAQFGIALAVGRRADGTLAVDHSSAILVIDPEARLAAVLSGPFVPAALQTDFVAIVGAPS